MCTGSTIADRLADLGLAVGKEHLKDRVEEYKLMNALKAHIERHRKYNDICSSVEEVDFQGLIDYIINNLLNDTEKRIFCANPKERGKALNLIIASAVAFSNANTAEAKSRVEHIVTDCLCIIREFYKKGIGKKEYLLAAETVDAINENTENSLKLTENKLIQTAKELSQKQTKDLADIISRGALYSPDRLIIEAKQGNLDFANERMKEVLSGLSTTHPLYPDYGYGMKNDTFISVPLTPDASKKYPVHYTFKGPIRIGGEYFNDPTIDPRVYAYRNQLTLTMDVQEAKKYLGNLEDPAHYEMDRMVGKQLEANPPEFPPAFPCAIIVGDTTFYDYILLRTQKNLDDGTLIFGNREQHESHFYFEVRLKLSDAMLSDETDDENPVVIENDSDFIIQIHDATNMETLNFVRFMKAISVQKKVRIHVLGTDHDIVAGKIDGVNYHTGFSSIDEEIDFLQRICEIEKYYHVSLDIHEEIEPDTYFLILKISDLIRNDEVTDTWEGAKFTGTIDKIFQHRLVEMSNEMYMISYVGNMDVHIMGADFEVKFMRTFKSAVLQDYERIRQLSALLKEGDSINLEFKPGNDNTVIDTLQIPKITSESSPQI